MYEPKIFLKDHKGRRYELLAYVGKCEEDGQQYQISRFYTDLNPALSPIKEADWLYLCPACDQQVFPGDGNSTRTDYYCRFCGQHIDWSGTGEKWASPEMKPLCVIEKELDNL